jgi:GNAT superfamily N-acetyltransferase|tara:strand:- start:2170 stop:2580 length:411 start_codon:yes stop_codon:yes gene_type:complete
MSELKSRLLKDSDWETLCQWWESWPKWVNPPKSFLPDNGKGGIMVEKEGKPIVAGFLYITNSDAVLLEWIVSDPEYRGKDRKDALELLISSAEATCKGLGKKHIFTIGRNKHLIETHKKLGWTVDPDPSYEIIKNV